MKPFSKNIIFVDTEFSTLNPYKGEILSIGLVKLNGEELYLELEYDGEISDWVKGNILPTLVQKKVSKKNAIDLIKEFVGDSKSYMVAYVNQFDAIYIYKLFGVDGHPFHWLPIDFASMLFGEGRNPEELVDFKDTCEEFGIDCAKYNQHNALDDAKLLREVYLKMSSVEVD